MNANRAKTALHRTVSRPAFRQRACSNAVDLRSLQVLAPLVSRYIPWSTSAIAPQTAVEVCNELALNERRTILELGTGVSTLIMAMWAESEQQRLRIISVDEDEAWIRLMEKRLESFDYVDISFLHAPLKLHRADDGAPPVTRWYDPQELRFDAGGGVDMLLVDGPTAYRDEWRFDRWPALPHLVDQLAPACAVLLDDTSRPGESTILRSWLHRFPDFVSRPSGPATWLVRGPTWHVY